MIISKPIVVFDILFKIFKKKENLIFNFEELNFKLPIVIRFQGTNASIGQEIINKSNLEKIYV